MIAGLLCIGVLVVFLGRMHFNRPGYTIYADFNYVDSLKVDAPILYGGGVKIGSVDSLKLVNGKVQLKLHIFKNIKLPADGVVTIHTSGILGEKYVQVAAGDLTRGILAPDAIVSGMDPGSIDRTLQRVEALTDFLTPLLQDPKIKKGFVETVSNLNQLTHELTVLVRQTGGDLKVSVANLRDLTQGLKTRTEELKVLTQGAQGFVTEKNRKNFESGLQTLDSTLGKLDKVLTQVDQRKGMLGALVYDEKSAETVRELLRDLKQHPWKLLWKK